MRIIYDIRPLQTPSRFRGIGTVTRNVLESLSILDTGNDYRLLRWPGDTPELTLNPSLRWQWMEVPRSHPTKLGWLLDQITLKRLLDGQGDCVHFLSPFDLDLGWPPGGRIPPRRIVTVHDLTPVLHTRDVLQGKYRLLAPLFAHMASNLRHAWQLICNSQFTADEVCAYLELTRDKVRVASLGVSSRFDVCDEASVAAFRERHGLLSPFLLYVGGSNPNKNLTRLLDAVQEIPDIPLVILLTQGLAAPEDSRIRLLHQIGDEELPLLYNAAHLFVLPSLFEGFGLPVLEAMSCATPVVCSDIPPLREVAADVARYFPPDDVTAMRNVVRSAWNDKAWLREAGERGKLRAAGFSWNRCARSILDVYQEAAE